MQAATLHCPDCGAPADPSATQCPYCHARLATVACPHCFGLVFLGMKHCPHCGDAIDREEVADDAVALACPRCAGELKPVQLGSSRVRECAGCAGLWVDNQTFLSICVDRERLADVGPERPAAGTSSAAGGIDTRVKYLRCPVCRSMMDRINFARVSGVVVDVCADHGTWFDRNELHRIVDFIAAGGLDRSLAHMRDEAFDLRLSEVMSQVTAYPHGPWNHERDAWSALFSHFTPHAGR
ncbi:zf-TFIIB domain-containing protein [Longimicrobium sp.]|uniref:zf-TFIIB domain-containing protein n=1 Tax=Longimicrobium sp. TaxID=2029185 RepID=UPI002C760BA7|nr:zf-TFIIB domain-containing protein [Longimicrobium sp.]HSU15497.1 zf-TFIIB domain-containing protein [Longimicrobium sp.]